MDRAEKAELHGLLTVGRSYSLEVLAEAEARGDKRRAARTRGHIEKADEAMIILERELAEIQPGQP